MERTREQAIERDRPQVDVDERESTHPCVNLKSERKAAMFAIFVDGGRQYRVKAGDLLRVDFRSEGKRGDKLTFDTVLCGATDTASVIGKPAIASAVVEAQITDPEFKAEKLEGGKFKRRKGYIRHWGHTQRYTEVQITKVTVPGLGSEEKPVAPKPETADAAN